MRSTIVLLFVLALIVAGCAAPDDGASSPTSDASGDEGTAGAGPSGTLRMSILGDEGTLTPFTHTTAPPLLDFVWDTLLVNDEENRLHPLVAESMDVGDDGTTYTFTIRPGQSFHDGEPLDAQDVVFSYEYQSQFGFAVGLLSVIESVEATDDDTVVITLSEPNSDFGQNVLASIKILPQHLYEGLEDPSDRGAGGDDLGLTVGSGPYRLVAYEPDQQYVFEAFEDYPMGYARFEQVVASIIPEAQTAFAALQADELDLVSVPVEPQLVPQFEADADIQLVSGSFFSPQMFHINTERAPLDRTEVRKALQLAVDPQELIETVALGQATEPNAGFIHPASPLIDEPIPHVHDPQAAIDLLEGIGAVDSDGDGVRELDGEPLSFSVLASSIETNSIRTAEIVAEQAADVGIELTVETLEAQTQYDRVWPGFDVSNGRDYDITTFTWQPVLQTRAGRFGSMVHSDRSSGGRGGLNISGYSSDEADAIVAEIDAARTEEDRTAAVQDLTEHIAAEAPFITMFYEDATYAYRAEPEGGWTYREGLGIVDVVAFAHLDVLE